MVEKVDYNAYAKEALQQLPKGAFMNVRVGDELNTMTIGWGNIGFIWGKPVFTALVRYSRHTYQLVEQADEFTVSFPLNGQLKKALGFCGSKSGRDVNKFDELSLTAVDGKDVTSPMIDECDLHYECKVVFKQPMDPEKLQESIKGDCYPEDNYHVIYYGEIVGTYIKQEES